MRKEELKVYASLFDVAETNLKESGETPIIKKTAFLSRVQSNQQSADLLLLEKLDREAFVQGVYAIALDRFIDEDRRLFWKENELDTETFQKTVVKLILESVEKKNNNIVVCNNIFDTCEKMEAHVIVQSGHLGLDRLLRIYAKLPNCLKSVVKKILK